MALLPQLDKRRMENRQQGMVSAVELKVARLSDTDDIEAHLTTFECLMTVDSVDQAELVVRLEVFLHNIMSMKGCGGVKDVLERVLVEYILSTMPEDLHLWVSERKPTTGPESMRSCR